MQSGDYENAASAIDAARANLSPRQKELDTLERFARGTQYEGRANFFDTTVPLWERAPCVVYPIVQIAIDSNVDLVLGEGRFPDVTSAPGEDDEEHGGLSREQSLDVDRAISELCDRVRFRSVSRQALTHAQESRSVACIAGTRKGKPFLELVRSRWCEPTFGDGGVLVKLEIRYPYLQPSKQADGKWKLSPFLYRRVIDEKADTTYLPVVADKSGREPPEDAWVIDKSKTVEHKLGFCPCHWYPHDKECSTVAEYDGRAVHETILDEVQALDFSLSTRHRSAIFCGDPQIVETGVALGYNPSGQVGRTSVPATMAGGTPSNENPVSSHYVSPTGQSARVKSPGIVWQYEDPNVKVAYLALPHDALKTLDENAADLRNKIAEALAVVIIDPQNAKFTSDMSGRAIEQLRARQFDRCDRIRDDVGDNWILPVVKLLLRIALTAKVKIKSIVAVRDVLTQFISDAAEAPMLFLRWRSGYVKPTADDENKEVTTTALARDKKLITRRMAVEKVAHIYNIQNVDQAVEALDDEEAESAAKQAAAGLAPPGAGAQPDDGAAPIDGSDGGGGISGSSDHASPKTSAAPNVDPASKPGQANAGTSILPGNAASGSASAVAKGKPAVTKAPAAPTRISQAGNSTSGVTESVYSQLAEDFPPESIAWVRAARWEGPIDVPLDEIDFANMDNWAASDDPERVQFFVERIQSGNRKPIILVNEPNNERLIVVDGHHRALAYKQLGLPAQAYVAHVTSVNGPWDLMHNAQRKDTKSVKTNEAA